MLEINRIQDEILMEVNSRNSTSNYPSHLQQNKSVNDYTVKSI